MRDTIAELTAHIGGTPNAVERLLIRRAASLSLKLTLLDSEPVLSEHDMRAYCAWSNHLRLVLRELGIKAAPAKVPTLAEHLAARAAGHSPPPAAA